MMPWSHSSGGSSPGISGEANEGPISGQIDRPEHGRPSRFKSGRDADRWPRSPSGPSPGESDDRGRQATTAALGPFSQNGSLVISLRGETALGPSLWTVSA
jgi:hypothetical protein